MAAFSLREFTFAKNLLNGRADFRRMGKQDRAAALNAEAAFTSLRPYL
jgi:hypothetical protein